MNFLRKVNLSKCMLEELTIPTTSVAQKCTLTLCTLGNFACFLQFADFVKN